MPAALCGVGVSYFTAPLDLAVFKYDCRQGHALLFV